LAAAVAAREQQEMFRSYEHQQQQDFLRFSGGFDVGSASSAGGFTHIPAAAASACLCHFSTRFLNNHGLYLQYFLSWLDQTRLYNRVCKPYTTAINYLFSTSEWLLVEVVIKN